MCDTLVECGVHYTFDFERSRELGYRIFLYDVEYIPNGTTFKNRRVYCRNQKEFRQLVEHWNRTLNWKVFPAFPQ